MICIVFLYEVCASVRMGVIGRCSGVTEITHLGWFKYHILGRLANIVFPQSGNIYRAHILKSRHAVSYAIFIGMSGLNVWVELVVALTFCSLLLFVGSHGMENHHAHMHFALFGSLLIVLSLPWVFHELVPRKFNSNCFVNQVANGFKDISAFVSGSIRNRVLVFKLVCMTVAMLSLSAFAQYLGFWALGYSISLPALAVFVLLLKSTNYVVLTPGNLGVRELAYGLIAGVIGVNVGQAIIVSLMIRGASYVNIFTIGLLFGWRETFRPRSNSPR